MQVKDIMSPEIVACAPDTSIRTVAKLLTENGFSGLPVVEGERVVGLISADELLKIQEPIHIPTFLNILGTAVYLDNPLDGDEVEKQIQQVLATQVRQIMNKEFKTVRQDLDVHELADLMVHQNLSIVPVVDERDVLVGVVTKGDLVKLLARE